MIAGISDAIDVPVEGENDVNLAAVAEREVGRAVGVDDFVLLWAEEGLGAAIVIDGRLHRGATGGAGEVGFLPLAWHAPRAAGGTQQCGGLPGARRWQAGAGSGAVDGPAGTHP